MYERKRENQEKTKELANKIMKLTYSEALSGLSQ